MWITKVDRPTFRKMARLSSSEFLAIVWVNVVAFRIPNYIFVGPVGVEFLYEPCGLLKLIAGCYEKKFAITKFRKNAIDPSPPVFL